MCWCRFFCSFFFILITLARDERTSQEKSIEYFVKLNTSVNKFTYLCLVILWWCYGRVCIETIQLCATCDESERDDFILTRTTSLFHHIVSRKCFLFTSHGFMCRCNADANVNCTFIGNSMRYKQYCERTRFLFYKSFRFKLTHTHCYTHLLIFSPLHVNSAAFMILMF